jgi:hypothetical protein
MHCLCFDVHNTTMVFVDFYNSLRAVSSEQFNCSIFEAVVVLHCDYDA